MPQLDVLVIGAGISGLATARKLAMQGHRVTVWEAQQHLGGKIQSRQQQGYLTEQAASMVVNYIPAVRDFLHQCGLTKHIRERQVSTCSNRYLVGKQGLQSVPLRIPALLKDSMFSRQQKWRFLTELFVPRGHPESESVSQFIERRFGREFLDLAMEPFVSGTLASNPDYANAAATLPRLSQLEKRFGSITAGVLISKLLGRSSAMNAHTFSFKQGMQTLPQVLADHPNITCHRGYRVNSLNPSKMPKTNTMGWQVNADTDHGERSVTVQQLVLSVPANVAAQLLKPLNSSLAKLLSEIQYAPLNVVHTGFAQQVIKQPLDASGFLVPRNNQAKINGNLWLSSAFAKRAPTNKALLSSYLGGMRRPEAVEWDDQHSIDVVCDDLQKLMGINSTPEFVHIDRHPQALPLYYGDYLGRSRAIIDMVRNYSGLHLQANYIGGVSVRDRLNQSHQTAQAIHAGLQARTFRLPTSVTTSSYGVNV